MAASVRSEPVNCSRLPGGYAAYPLPFVLGKQTTGDRQDGQGGGSYAPLATRPHPSPPTECRGRVKCRRLSVTHPPRRAAIPVWLARGFVRQTKPISCLFFRGFVDFEAHDGPLLRRGGRG